MFPMAMLSKGSFDGMFGADCLDYLEWLRWPLRKPNVRDCGHHLRSDPHPAHGLVRRLLAFRDGKGRYLSAELEADLGDRVLPDGMGHAASSPVRAGPPGSGAPQRTSQGGRDLYRMAGAWAIFLVYQIIERFPENFTATHFSGLFRAD